MKTAIIGSGISGLGTAYALNEAGHDIMLYEKNNYLGGHSRTIDINVDNQKMPVDTGFIVFNYRNYPHLTGLFKHLDVAVEKSDMSFGADIASGWLQYSSKNMIRPQNLIRPQYWKMIWDIVKFNKNAVKYLEKPTSITIAQCLDEMKMGKWFRNYYLQAMGAAIWSCPISKIEDFPAKTFVRFFQNHGLLTVNDHPQWYTVTGGSRAYVKKVTASFKDKIKLACGVEHVERKDGKVVIHDEHGGRETFDQVVFACHANQAIAMLEKPTDKEQEIIGAFTYQDNRVVVHSDLDFMPSDKSCWASWVYLSAQKTDLNNSVSLSYWMNNLQNLKTDTPVIITLNPAQHPKSDLIYDIHHFDHPVFNRAAIEAQEKIADIQGDQGCWYAGAYQRYGFHEDGLLSAVNVLEKMDVKIPWT